MTTKEAKELLVHVLMTYEPRDQYGDWDDSEPHEEAITMAIEALSADRPTGEWVLKEHLWECDQCGCRINRAKPLKGNIWNYNFCPNCGAKMGGDSDE